MMRGFTLIEMVITITLIGILVAALGPLTAHPFSAYASMRQRAQLVALADGDFSLMLRDVHQALPNSLRVNAAGTAFELIHVANAGRYRAIASNTAGSDTLDFTQADSSFQVAGNFPSPSAGSQLVIYHTGQSGANAYAGDTVITPPGTSVTSTPGTPESVIQLSTAQQFPYPSSMQRFYIVDTPVTYSCQGGQLLRYDQYALQTAVASPPASARSTLVSDLISACSFSYLAGTATRSGVITLNLSLSSGGENITLLEQAHVDNGI